MSDFMCWLYDHYIRPHIEGQNKDDGDELRYSLMECASTKQEREDIATVLRFYACHAFLLGLKTGAGLSKSLEQKA